VPNKDPVKHKANNDRWRDQATRKGYNVALYTRRRMLIANEKVLRAAIEDVLANQRNLTQRQMLNLLRIALESAPEPGPPSNYLPEGYVYKPRPKVDRS